MSTEQESNQTSQSRMLLTTKNYLTWATMMESKLDRHDYLEITLGQESLKDDERNEEVKKAYRTKSRKAYNIIIEYLNEDNLALVSSNAAVGTARDAMKLWNFLKDKYMAENVFNRTVVFTRFLNITFKDIESFITEIRTTTNEMRRVGMKLSEQMQVIMALSKLPSEYESFVRIMCHGFGNESMEFILTRLEQDCAQKTAANSEANRASVFNTNASNNRPTVTCSHCKKNGHLEHKCWKAHPELAPRSRFRTQ